MSLAAVFFAALLHSPPLTGAVDEPTHGVSSAYFEIHESRRLSPSSGVAVSSKVFSAVECALACRRLPGCLSYNFEKTPDKNGRHICECLDVHKATNTEYFIPSDEFDHYSVLVDLSEKIPAGKNREHKYYNSCKEAYDDGRRDDQAYELGLDHGKTRVYCHMSTIPGCGAGGYTLVMKIDGSASTFSYDSALWTNRIAYNVPGGSSLNASEETKLPTYWESPFRRICLGMTVAGQTSNYLAINYAAESLFALIADGQYRATTLGRDAWKALISGSSLQVNCNKEGFNAVPVESGHTRARIGIISNQEDNCETNDSRLGFGTKGLFDRNNSCGNSARYRADNGDTEIKAFGYIFVQ